MVHIPFASTCFILFLHVLFVTAAPAAPVSHYTRSLELTYNARATDGNLASVQPRGLGSLLVKGFKSIFHIGDKANTAVNNAQQSNQRRAASAKQDNVDKNAELEGAIIPEPSPSKGDSPSGKGGSKKQARSVEDADDFELLRRDPSIGSFFKNLGNGILNGVKKVASFVL